VSACCIGLFSIEHVELGATLILDALAKTALEHQHGAGLGRVLRRECVEVRASCYMTAVCAVVGGSDQSLNIFALPLYRRGGSTEKSPKQAARVIYILQQARSPRNRLQGAFSWTGTGCNSTFWERCLSVDLAAGAGSAGSAKSKKIVCVPLPRQGGVCLSACACLLLEDSMHVRLGGGIVVEEKEDKERQKPI
jgi:hypothetical protein